MEEVDQRLHNRVLPLLHAQGHDLEGQVIAKFVHGQARQAVALAEDHPAGVGEAQLPPEGPGRLDAPPEEGGVDDLVGIAGQHPHRDFAPGIEVAPGHELAAAVDDVHNAARGADVVVPVDFVVINPKAAPAEVRFLPPPQAYLAVFHRVSLYRRGVHRLPLRGAGAKRLRGVTAPKVC